MVGNPRFETLTVAVIRRAIPLGNERTDSLTTLTLCLCPLKESLTEQASEEIRCIVCGMTPIFWSSLDGSPDRQRGWRKDEHHDHSSKEVS